MQDVKLQHKPADGENTELENVAQICR